MDRVLSLVRPYATSDVAVFTSFNFAGFVAIVYALYLLLQWVPRGFRLQNVLLLVASFAFYGLIDWRLLVLLSATIGVDFTLARMIAATDDGRTRKRLITISVVFNLAILGFFKYFNFFIASLAIATQKLGFQPHLSTLTLIATGGLSFYIFKSLTYTIDVYRGKLEPTRSPLDYALYVSFFPQILAGPIDRARTLLPQIAARRTIAASAVQAGLFLIIWGYFKKMVIADNLSTITNPIFGLDTFRNYDGLDVTLGVVAYTFQIYCDFSGYTDIARGIMKCMGFEPMLNFRLPYAALDPSDFWRRWHISLSTWLRDYLYIPLGGNRGGELKTYRNLMLTMILGGLWHGPAWNFVLWGAFHGAILVAYRVANAAPDQLTLRAPPRRYPIIFGKWVLMLVLIHIGWLLFAAKSLDQVGYLFGHLGVSPSARSGAIASDLLFYCLPLVLMQVAQHVSRDLLFPLRLPLPLRAIFFGLLIVWTAIFGSRASTEFIYFQF